MARQTFRLNTGSADFPFLSHMYGRSIVYPQQDMNYVRPNAFSGAEADKNIGIPQLIFAEDVMPTSVGYQSIAYLSSVPSIAQVDFDQAFFLRDAAENRTLFVPGVVGTTAKRYTYNPATQVWSSSSKTIPDSARCTISNLKSRTFIKFEFDDEFFEWTGAWNTLAFTGLTAANIKGLTSANAYNIAYDYNTIYWSSTTDPVDFVPSLVSGAGSQRILANRGRIVVCYPIDDGFIIYTTVNIIIAKYSNNIRFPWNFKAIKNSAGIADQEQACADGGDGANFWVYTSNGMLECSPSKATQVFPALSEFLGRRMIETFENNSLVLTNAGAPIRTKLEYVANRWLVLSYGITELTHALIYDVGLKRWGKLKITHVDCFEFFGNTGNIGTTQALTWAQLNGTWIQQNNTWAEYGNVISGGSAAMTQPYRSLAFLQKNGAVKIVDFSLENDNDAAVAIIGRIQFLRDKFFDLHEVVAENFDAAGGTKTTLQVWSSLDGLNIYSRIYPMKRLNTGKLQEWIMRLSGQNHNLVFQGNFDLNTVTARGTLTGKR